MAKKTGTCVNIDCEHYKEVFEIQAGEEFECPHCHQELREATGGHKGKNGGKNSNGNGKKIILIVAIIAVVAIGVFCITKGCSSKVDTEQTDGGRDTITPPTPLPTPLEPDSGSTKPKPQRPLPPGTVDLGYAYYVGDLKDGKPHGRGILTYKQEKQIVSSKDFVAKPGDTFEGEFRNGRISSIGGYWKHDGNETFVKP